MSSLDTSVAIRGVGSDRGPFLEGSDFLEGSQERPAWEMAQFALWRFFRDLPARGHPMNGLPGKWPGLHLGVFSPFSRAGCRPLAGSRPNRVKAPILQSGHFPLGPVREGGAWPAQIA